MLAALPVAVLVVDIARFPSLFEYRKRLPHVGILPLLSQRAMQVGTLAAHNVYLSIDSIYDRNYLSYLDGAPNGLVLSHFLESGKDDSVGGALGAAVRWTLKRVSPSDNQRLTDLLGQASKHRSGDVLQLSLNLAGPQHDLFPIDRLFVILISKGPSGERADDIGKGIAEAVALAGKEKIRNLIVPCVAYNWEDRNTMAFSGFFEPVLKAAVESEAPRNLYLSLYSGWPTSSLEDAVGSFNQVWQESSRAPDRTGTVLHRSEIRLILLLLPVCILASANAAAMTMRNYVIIVTSFVASALGTGKTVDAVTQGYGPSVSIVARAICLIVLAASFPLLVNWNPKNIFGQKKE
ncbi:MAG TPA: hypothetical protein VKG01_15350 [Thermoanaerobaculia bacterium]|nr:hypothetical protein [Thermoanaerobaculia bacterium]